MSTPSTRCVSKDTAWYVFREVLVRVELVQVEGRLVGGPFSNDEVSLINLGPTRVGVREGRDRPLGLDRSSGLVLK